MTDPAPNTHYRRAVTAGFLSVASVSGVRYSFGVCIPAAALDLHVSLATITAAVTLHWIVFTITAPFAWRVFARTGPRPMIVLGGALACLGMLLSALSGSALGIIVAFGILVGLGTHGFGQMTAGASVVDAPLDQRDRYLGVIASGAPLGTAVYPALAAILVALQGWRVTLAVIGSLVLLVTMLSARLLDASSDTAFRARRVESSGTRTMWRHATFLLLAMGFLITLGTQIAVPLLMPIWAIELGVGAEQLAAAFIVLGVSGLAGRLVLTSATGWFSLRLWVTVPAAGLAVAGCAIAIVTHAAAGMYVAAGLLGMSTPVFGALFNIAALACFPAVMYARVTGSMLVPIGLGAGLAPLLMSAVIERQQSTALVWAAIGVLICIAAAFFLAAEAGSPEYRLRTSGDRGVSSR